MTKDKLYLKELIIKLSKKFGDDFTKYVLNADENKIQSHIIILINDLSVDLLNNLNTILRDNDSIIFLPSIHGGIL